MDGMQVRDAMTHLAVTLRPGDSVVDAARVLSSNRISGAPVVEDGRVAGVVSEADLMRALSSPRRRGPAQPLMLLLLRGTAPGQIRDLRVGDVMSRRVISIGPRESIWEAAGLIHRHGVRRLPVLDDDGYLIGVLARSDLVRCMASGLRSGETGRPLSGLPAPA
jgi:CBS domain-containing protein